MGTDEYVSGLMLKETRNITIIQNRLSFWIRVKRVFRRIFKIQ